MLKALMLSRVSAPDALHCAKLADEKGMDGIWIPEMTSRDSVSVLGAIATVTKRIRLVPSLLNVFSRSPALIAMTLATLQELSGGRVIGGLGVGNHTYIREVHGMAFKEPLHRLKEAVEIIRRALSGEPFTFEGRFFSIRWGLGFRPPTRVPLYLGAHNPKMLRLAGEVGDGVILNVVSTDDVRRASRVVREGAKAQGRSPEEVDIAAILMAAIDEDEEKAERRVRRLLAFYLARDWIRRRLLASEFAGEVPRIEEALRRGGIEEIAKELPSAMVRELAVFGDREMVERRLEAYAKAGVKQAVLYPAGGLGDDKGIIEAFLAKL